MTSDLIARLEKAYMGVSALDEAIASQIGLKHHSRRDRRGRSKGREWFIDSHGGIESWGNCPEFTTSIDAKLPDEDIVRVEKMHDINGPIWIAEAAKYGCLVVEGRGRTEALARRIAALRAREIQEDS